MRFEQITDKLFDLFQVQVLLYCLEPHLHVCIFINPRKSNKSVNLEWFPRLRCMSLDMEEPEQEQNEMKDLMGQLEGTNSLVKHLSTQLAELRDKVCQHVHVYITCTL